MPGSPSSRGAPAPTASESDSAAPNGGCAKDQDQWRLAPGQLVIVDEASLADTRTLAALVTQAGAAHAKVLLVGDHLQRGSVDAGGAFAMLARRGPTAELTTLWRFTHPWEARASLELRHAQPTALDAYERHGAVSAGTSEVMLDAALDAVTAAREGGRVAILQAVDNRTVAALNARAHADGILTGSIAGRGVTLGDGRTAGVGDRIVTRRNNRRLHTTDGYVRNGAFWDITAILPGGAVLARPAQQGGAVDSDGASVRLPASYVRAHVDLGYATTTARTQGMTVDETHTIAAAGMGREDLYVAMSRGSDLNRVYVLTDSYDDDCLPRTGKPPTGRDILEQILATSHTELTATNSPGNGLLLRADLHTLLDLQLIAIEPETRTLRISILLADSEYARYDRIEVMTPAKSRWRPDRDALESSWLEFEAAESTRHSDASLTVPRGSG